MEFKINIDASPEKIWDVLWNDKTYPVWTSVWTESSHAVTDGWKQGTKVLFLDADKNGMTATIMENRPNEFMSFRHDGEVKEGVEKPDASWADSRENYTLTPVNGQTELLITMLGADQYKEMFEKTWPVALRKVKELAEG